MTARGALAGVVGILAVATPAAAFDEDTVPSITVEGRASRDVAPDQAVITIGVATERATALDAATANGAAAQAVLDAIKAAGIAASDVATAGATLAPVYNQGRDGATQQLRGYRAANTVSIKLRDPAGAGALAGRLIDKGANTLEGVEFSVADPEPVLDALRADATRDAKRRAVLYAEAAGVRLGRILSIRPDGAAPPEPRAFRLAAAAAPAGPTVPLQAGTQHIEATVGVTWALEQP